VDGWNPAYGTSFEQAETGDGPTNESSAQVNTDVEVKTSQWAPVPLPTGLAPPPVVLLVDGVRRIDAELWTREDDGTSYPGVAASYAAGVVRCDLRRGAAQLVARKIDRGLFTASQEAPDLMAGTVHYRVHRVGTSDPTKLSQTVQGPLTELEVEVSTAARRSTLADDDLLVVDGPLRRRRNLPRTLGYVKKQQGKYLSAQLSAVVTALGAGERCPVFRIGTAWGGYSWYLRLPSPSGAPWAGIVRVECSTELDEAEAIALANLSQVTLPRFASTSYKDPRAPQNLIPIAGLERRLRSLLGDGRLLHRALTLAATRAPARRRAS
jgi:hypothetical protein